MSHQPHSLSQPTTPHLVAQIGMATFGRLIINSSRRFIYPFAATLSQGMGVPLTWITSLIAINQGTGLLSPFFGPLSDRWGYRLMMLLGLSLVVIGMGAAGVWPLYAILVGAMFVAGLGKSVFDPALQAYVGEQVPYHRRGLAIGVVEFSWAGSTLVSLPLIGLLINSWGWQAPFWVLAGFALLATVGLAWAIPAAHSLSQTTDRRLNFRQAWHILRAEPAALGGLAFGFYVSAANDLLFVVYGLWLTTDFGLTIPQLGFATTVIGLAELIGESLTATVADRLGLRRALIGGTLVTTGSYLLLPWLQQTLTLALIGLFIVFLAFEFAMVTSFSTFTETLPQARATMMSSYLATASFGRVVGALLGGSIWLLGEQYDSSGLVAICLSAALLNTLALLYILWGLKHQTTKF